MANRPARTTPYLGIPVPADNELADYVTGWGQVADATDAKTKTAIEGASASFATQLDTANGAFGSAIASAQSAALPYTFLLMGA